MSERSGSPDAGTSLGELVERLLDTRDAGGDVGRFLCRHPRQADVLREILAEVEDLERCGDVLAAEHAVHRRAATLVALRRIAERTTRDPELDSEIVEQIRARSRELGACWERYTTEAEIARGGQGALLRVFDGHLQRHLAMKVALASEPRGDVGSSYVRSLGRFLGEAQVTAQLDHPGIVPVHDLGIDRESRLYFTMKLVKGRDFRTILDPTPREGDGWSRARAVGVLLKVCEAMAYAHSRGVLHRDLKPSNVMVGEFGEVYVMDWGLARVLGERDSRDIRLRVSEPGAPPTPPEHSTDDVDSPLRTMDGDVVGTPAYMPPEQALGNLEAMGPHSDVYAAGAMLYHLLTGQMPYSRPGERPTSAEVWARLRKGPPTPVEMLARDAPSELVAICEKAMARDECARYSSMDELAEDLRAFLELRVVRAYETGAFAQLRKWVRRNKALAVSLAGAFVLALGGLGGIGYVQ